MRRILIIEDNLLVKTTTILALKKYFGDDHTVEWIADGEDNTLDGVFKKNIRFNIVLCDFDLGVGKRDGAAIIQAIRKRKDYPIKNPPVFIGHTSDPVKNADVFNEAGASGTMGKLTKNDKPRLLEIIASHNASKIPKTPPKYSSIFHKLTVVFGGGYSFDDSSTSNKTTPVEGSPKKGPPTASSSAPSRFKNKM